MLNTTIVSLSTLILMISGAHDDLVIDDEQFLEGIQKRGWVFYEQAYDRAAATLRFFLGKMENHQ